MKYLIPLIALWLLVGCDAQPKESSATQQEVVEENANSALLTKEKIRKKHVLNDLLDLSYSELLITFGKENLKEETQLIEEGTKTAYIAILFEGTDEEVSFFFTDEKRATPAFICINGTNNKWSTEDGFSLGMTLTDLDQKKGGKEFMFYGFGWDNGGLILWEKNVDSHLNMYLELPEHYIGNDLLGDVEYSSKLPLAQKINPKLTRIELHT